MVKLSEPPDYIGRSTTQMTNTDYDGDLNKASAFVRTLVRTYDTAAGSQFTAVTDTLIEGIHVQTMSGEQLNPVDSLWLAYLCKRHVASKVDTEHDICVETTLSLQGLVLRALELQLPTLEKTLEGLAAHLYRTHGVCVDKAQTARKAQAEADDPYKTASDFVDDMVAAGAGLMRHLPRIVADGIGLGVTIGKAISDLGEAGKRSQR